MSVWIINQIIVGAGIQTIGNIISLALIVYVQSNYTDVNIFHNDYYYKDTGLTFWFYFINLIFGYTEIYIGYTIYLT